jgi:uncharacterized protein involved in exopolysaccharide biosynthesis
MSDLDKRLDNIERQLSVISSHQSSVSGDPISSHSNEIDLHELFVILWWGRWWIVGITFLFAVAGVFYAKSLPDIYKSSGVYASAQGKSDGISAGSFGGLAAFAGVSFGGENGDLDEAIALVTSLPFLSVVVESHNLKPLIMGVKGWDRDERELIWNGDIYDSSSGKWVRKPPPGKLTEPSNFEVYKEFLKNLEVIKDKKTELITISFSHVSPDVAKMIVDAVVFELNKHFRQRDMVTARDNVDYLKQKIEETSLAEMQGVFYEMIEGQLKKLMLAEVGADYLIRPVVESVVAEERSAPSRVLILLLAVVFGGVVSLSGVLIWQFKWGRS